MVAFKSGMVNIDSFGIPLSTLESLGKGFGGRWSHLAGMGLLLGIGEKQDNMLELNIPVPEDGTWYLNLLLYKSGAYGNIRFSAGGKSATFNAQDTTPQTKMITLGPLNLKKANSRCGLWWTKMITKTATVSSPSPVRNLPPSPGKIPPVR